MTFWAEGDSKEGSFSLFLEIRTLEFPIFGLSTKSLETLGVCPSVRTYVARFLGNRSLLFSETLQLVRACKFEKNVPSAFLIIFTVLAILAKNWSKWPFGWMCAPVSLRTGNP